MQTQYGYVREYIDLIENIQHYYTKHIIGMQDFGYEARLKRLRLPNLEYNIAE